MTEIAPKKSIRKHRNRNAHIDGLMRLANQAKNQSEYGIARQIFAFLVYRYFRVFANHGLILLESSRPQAMYIPSKLKEWVRSAYPESSCTRSPYLDFTEYSSFPKEVKEVWGLVCRSGGANLVTLLSPCSDERLCIPTPRLKGNARGILYVVAQQVPRHTSTRVTTPATPETQALFRDALRRRTSEKDMARAVRHILKPKEKK